MVVDQRLIGRTPRSDLATYIGPFDLVRKVFAIHGRGQVPRGYGVGRLLSRRVRLRCLRQYMSSTFSSALMT